MGKVKAFFSYLPAIIYFLCIMWWVLFLLFFLPFMQITEIDTIRSSGYSNPTTGMTIVAFLGLLISLSLLIPQLRKMYYKLPWMLPYVMIWYINSLIMSIAAAIISKGYEVKNPERHTLFFYLMIGQILLCRLIMCIFFNRKKFLYIGGSANE